MKSRKNIRELLGLSQEELALLLNVSRSHYSLYELGKRELPDVSLQRLGELLTHVQTIEMETQSKSRSSNDGKYEQQVLEAMLRENEFRILKLSRSISTAQKKYESKVRVLNLMNLLHAEPKSKNRVEPIALKVIASKAKKGVESPDQSLLFGQRIKLEVLELEKKLLLSKLKMISR